MNTSVVTKSNPSGIPALKQDMCMLDAHDRQSTAVFYSNSAWMEVRIPILSAFIA